MISIGELSTLAGVSVRALRYYEEQGLLSVAGRNARGHRQYADSAVERVGMIQRLYAAGLSSQTILAICPGSDPEHYAGHRGQCLHLLREERERLEAQVQHLLTAQARLDTLIADTEAANDAAFAGFGPDANVSF